MGRFIDIFERSYKLDKRQTEFYRSIVTDILDELPISKRRLFEARIKRQQSRYMKQKVRLLREMERAMHH